MDLAGRHLISSSPQAVWDGLHDANLLQACIPGCERFEKMGETGFDIIATIRIGSVQRPWTGKIALSELRPPLGLRVRAEGRDGSDLGDAFLTLAPKANGTELSYRVTALPGGRVAEFGKSEIIGAARQIMDDFFARFSTRLSKATGVFDPFAKPIAPPRSPKPEIAGMRIWMGGLVAVVVILLLFFVLVL